MFSNGSILFDNTTIYGAKQAIETWPPQRDDWLQGVNALNLRSLMDLIEGIILYDQIVVDGSSSGFDSDYRDTEWDSRWSSLESIKDLRGHPVFISTSFADLGGRDGLVSLAANVALEKLQKYLRDGDFQQELDKFAKVTNELVVPDFYRSPVQFSKLLAQSFHNELPFQTGVILARIEQVLLNSLPAVSNYAMFAFRGFYYQQLAHLVSISYSPHTWRANIIDFDLDKPRINFAKYLTESIGDLREELAENLNAEFNSNAFTADFPVLASFVARSCTKRDMLLNVAVEIRNSKSVQSFRDWIRDIQESLTNQEDLVNIGRAQSELRLVISDIRRELGLVSDEKNVQVKVKVGIPLASLEVPTNIRYKIPDWLRWLIHRESHLVFLRDITKQSVDLPPFAFRFHQMKG